MFDICAPALIYVAFSLTQIIIDTFKGLYNTALVKFIVMVMITILLNALCQRGLGVASWIIVFIPFIFMTFIVSILLYIFGLDMERRNFNITNKKQLQEKTQDGNLVFSTNQNSNITIPNPNSTYIQLNSDNNKTISNPFYTFFTSDPSYESFTM